MCTVSVRILLTFITQVHVKELSENHIGELQDFADVLVDKIVDNLRDRAPKILSQYHMNLDNTVLNKPNHLATPTRLNLPMLPNLQPILCDSIVAGHRRAQAPFVAHAEDLNAGSIGKVGFPVAKRGSSKLRILPRRFIHEASEAAMGVAILLGASAAQADTGNEQTVAKIQQATEPVKSGLDAFLADPEVQKLGLTFVNTVIGWSVPPALLGIAGLAIVSISGGFKQSDKQMAGEMQPFGFPGFQKKPGDVKEFLKIERVNDELESYRYSITKALRNEKQAKFEKQRSAFARKFGAEIASHLDDGQMKKLVEADKKFQRKTSKLNDMSSKITGELRAAAAKSASDKGSGKMGMGSAESMQKRQSALAKQYSEAEFQYVEAISAALPKQTREEFAKVLNTSQVVLKPDASPFLSVEEPPSTKPHVFFLQFNGGIQATQVEDLRREVTAVVRAANATRSDEVVLRLTSPGGTVTGYGRAAAQLTRIKKAGLKLTICVEEVAASGGYMMACVADHLVASPMAVLGSIGVITEIPNAYQRLEKEGLRFLTVTAGEYKRTLTPFKKPTSEDELKLKEDIGMVWSEFKSFVQEQRPVLDVEKYGTGETWYGREALNRKLCDEIANSDDVILNKLDGGAEIYRVKYKEPKEGLQGVLMADAKFPDFRTVRTLVGRLLLGESLTDIIQPPATRKYMAIDRTAENTHLLDEQ